MAEDAPRVIFVTGPPRVGKTATLERVLARFAETSTEILRWHPSRSMPPRLRGALVNHTQPSPDPPPRDGPAAIVIVIDDAHRMPAETVRVLRRTVAASQQSFPMLRLLLVGGPALLAALPRSTPFRLPGNSCIHIRVRRTVVTPARKITRRKRPSKPRTRRPAQRGRESFGTAAASKRASYKGTATGLLLIAILVFALLMGDRMTPESIRPTLSSLPASAETGSLQGTSSSQSPAPPAPERDPAAAGSSLTDVLQEAGRRAFRDR